MHPSIDIYCGSRGHSVSKREDMKEANVLIIALLLSFSN